jgi:hypothetical protein
MGSWIGTQIGTQLPKTGLPLAGMGRDSQARKPRQINDRTRAIWALVLDGTGGDKDHSSDPEPIAALAAAARALSPAGDRPGPDTDRPDQSGRSYAFRVRLRYRPLWAHL